MCDVGWYYLSDDIHELIQLELDVISRLRLTQTCKELMDLLRKLPFYMSANKNSAWYDVDASLVERYVKRVNDPECRLVAPRVRTQHLCDPCLFAVVYISINGEDRRIGTTNIAPTDTVMQERGLYQYTQRSADNLYAEIFLERDLHLQGTIDGSLLLRDDYTLDFTEARPVIDVYCVARDTRLSSPNCVHAWKLCSRSVMDPSTELNNFEYHSFLERAACPVVGKYQYLQFAMILSNDSNADLSAFIACYPCLSIPGTMEDFREEDGVICFLPRNFHDPAKFMQFLCDKHDLRQGPLI